MSLRLSGGRKLQSPPGSTARPSSSRLRQAVMNMLAPDLAGARWLDLFCGSGVMGCEALQRGVQDVVAVDQDRRMAATTRANLGAVASGLDHPVCVAVVQRDVLRWLASGSDQAGGAFDLIYADPPYLAGLYGAIAEAVAKGSWLNPGGQLLWECSSAAIPEAPQGWEVLDQRRYGGCSLLRLRRT